jgi:hypothetical protein
VPAAVSTSSILPPRSIDVLHAGFKTLFVGRLRQAGGGPQCPADLLERGIRARRNDRGQSVEIRCRQRAPAKIRLASGARMRPFSRRRCFSASTQAPLT